MDAHQLSHALRLIAGVLGKGEETVSRALTLPANSRRDWHRPRTGRSASPLVSTCRTITVTRYVGHFVLILDMRLKGADKKLMTSRATPQPKQRKFSAKRI